MCTSFVQLNCPLSRRKSQKNVKKIYGILGNHFHIVFIIDFYKKTTIDSSALSMFSFFILHKPFLKIVIKLEFYGLQIFIAFDHKKLQKNTNLLIYLISKKIRLKNKHKNFLKL